MIRVRITESELAKIRKESVKSFDEETGGHLFGVIDHDQIVVNLVRSAKGRRKRFAFIPDAKAVQALIDKVWRETRGEMRRVGTWHTHPGGVAAPSVQDAVTAELLATEGGIQVPVLVIVATSKKAGKTGVGAVRAWVWDPDRRVLANARLEIENGVLS